MKNIDKLIQNSSIVQQVSKKSSLAGSKKVEIPLDKIDPSPFNEGLFDVKESVVKKVAESIDHRGFDGAIGLYDMGNGRYQLYSGHIRYEAQKLRGAKTIPAFIKAFPANEEEEIYDLISSNLDGRHLSPMERARALAMWEDKVLKDYNGNINQELARRFGMSQPTVKRLKRLLQLIPELQEKADEEGVMYSALYKASTLSEKDQHVLDDKINRFIEANGILELNKPLVESYIRDIQEKSSPPKPKQVRVKSARLPKACSSFITALSHKEDYSEEDKDLIRASLMEIRERVEEKLKEL